MNKNVEMMKKLIEEKKKKANSKSANQRATKTIGKASNSIKSNNGGGLFDK